jgi:nucleoside-diphosphate-sugar epimerase
LARVLIVGCGCAGTQLGRRLAADGWAVRGTSRSAEGAARIESAGIEGVVADPDRVGTVLEHVGDVTIAVWALAGASGPGAGDVNGPRLERMLERLVDTPVRGFVLDAVPGDADAIELVDEAHRTWRLPVRVVTADRSTEAWAEAIHAAVGELLGAAA